MLLEGVLSTAIRADFWQPQKNDTHVWKWPVVKYKHIKIKPRICVLFILCLTWTVNANSLKQNIVVIKEICSWLPPFCKPNLLLFIQPRWQLRRRYVCILRLAIFTHVYFAKNAAYFPFNSWLSFQRLCRLLWGYTSYCAYLATSASLRTKV